jgi:hypothetical protein
MSLEQEIGTTPQKLAGTVGKVLRCLEDNDNAADASAVLTLAIGSIISRVRCPECQTRAARDVLKYLKDILEHILRDTAERIAAGSSPESPVQREHFH